MSGAGSVLVSKSREQYSPLFNAISGVAIFNLALIAVSFTPWFSGTSGQPGFADWLFPNHTFEGFRPDFLWLIVSNVLLFLLFFPSLSNRQRPAARGAAVLLAVEITAFILLVVHSLTSGLLYMG